MKYNKFFAILAALILMTSSLAFAQEESQPEQPPAEEEPPQEEQPQTEGQPSQEEQAPTEIPEEREEQPEGPSEEMIPEGCSKKETGSGLFEIECDVEKESFKEFDIKEDIENCEGRFELIDGNPTCIKEGKAGFIGTECPKEEELSKIKEKCAGKIEEFKDEQGCSSVMCIDEGFKEKYDKKIEAMYKDDPIKKEAMLCRKDGGKLIFVNNQPKCIQKPDDNIKIKDLGEITSEDISKAEARITTLRNKLEKVTEKLKRIEERYSEAGKNEQVAAFKAAVEKMEAVQAKIDNIEAALSSELTEDERVSLIADIQSLQRAVGEATIGIVEGKVKTQDEIDEESFEQYNEFYNAPFGSKEELKKMAEKEKGAIDIIRNCDKYTSIKSFPAPDPEGMVSRVDVYGLADGKCKVVLNSAQGEAAEFYLPTDVYTVFKGPGPLLNLECRGSCGFMKPVFEMIKLKGPKTEFKEEMCTRECVMEGCDLGMMQCTQLNYERCEKECGLKKEPEMASGLQKCISDCVGPGVMCKPMGGEIGESNPKCKSCAAECVKQYGSGNKCLTEEQLEAKKRACKTCEHCDGEPVKGASGQGYDCIVEVKCFDASSEWGDNPGSGPTGSFAKEKPRGLVGYISGLIGRLLK